MRLESFAIGSPQKQSIFHLHGTHLVTNLHSPIRGDEGGIEQNRSPLNALVQYRVF
jgi:hypothetical protein